MYSEILRIQTLISDKSQDQGPHFDLSGLTQRLRESCSIASRS